MKFALFNIMYVYKKNILHILKRMVIQSEKKKNILLKFFSDRFALTPHTFILSSLLVFSACTFLFNVELPAFWFRH